MSSMNLSTTVRKAYVESTVCLEAKMQTAIPIPHP
jgi:hypothetical protein